MRTRPVQGWEDKQALVGRQTRIGGQTSLEAQSQDWRQTRVSR